MNEIGEINGRRPLRKFHDAALGRETVYVVVLHRLPPFGLRHVASPRKKLPQPRDALFVRGRGAERIPRLLVAPVRSHAEFGEFVHRARTDLNFDGPPRLVRHDGVQRLIAVGFRVCDVVVVLLREDWKLFLNDREHRVALFDRPDDDAHGPDVKELIKAQVLSLHLLPDGIDVLRAPRDVRRDVILAQKLLNARHGLVDELDALGAVALQFARDGVVFLGTREAKREILELPLDLPDAETVGERRVERERVFAIGAALLTLARSEPTQSLQTAREFQEHDAQILAHGKEHAARRFGIGSGGVFPSRAVREIVDAPEFLHEAVDVRAETLFNPFARILNDGGHAKEISRGHEFGVVSKAPQNFGDAVGMRQRVFARGKRYVFIKRLRQGAGQVHIDRRRCCFGRHSSLLPFSAVRFSSPCLKSIEKILLRRAAPHSGGCFKA